MSSNTSLGAEFFSSFYTKGKDATFSPLFADSGPIWNAFKRASSAAFK